MLPRRGGRKSGTVDNNACEMRVKRAMIRRSVLVDKNVLRVRVTLMPA